jgi:hypothetical protein
LKQNNGLKKKYTFAAREMSKNEHYLFSVDVLYVGRVSITRQMCDQKSAKSETM